MISSRSVAGILFGISAFFYGCDRLTPLPKNIPQQSAPVPNRDELYVFNYGRLSMDAFDVLRREFPGVSAADLARLAMTAQWLAKVTGSNDLKKTTHCVRILFKPELSGSTRAEADRLLREDFHFKSSDELRQKADDASHKWSVEWNPALTREYGINTAN
jgi:hypothetical protein